MAMWMFWLIVILVVVLAVYFILAPAWNWFASRGKPALGNVQTLVGIAILFGLAFFFLWYLQRTPECLADEDRTSFKMLGSDTWEARFQAGTTPGTVRVPQLSLTDLQGLLTSELPTGSTVKSFTPKTVEYMIELHDMPEKWNLKFYSIRVSVTGDAEYTKDGADHHKDVSYYREDYYTPGKVHEILYKNGFVRPSTSGRSVVGQPTNKPLGKGFEGTFNR